MYDIFGYASDFAHNFRHLMPTTLNCGATYLPIMGKYQLKDNKGLEFIQLGEIGIEDERIFSLMDQPVRKNGGALVGFLLLLAEV